MSVEQPLFYTAKTIKHKDRSDIVSIKTGISLLDKKIIGLNKGEVTCVSGLRGSAKSSLLSQISIEIADMGRKVALFSGELMESRVLEWLQLQAAGKYHTIPSSYENYFSVGDRTRQQINEWLEQKIFVYNNAYGKKVETIMKSMEDCINKKGVDVIILDNLMSINLESNNYNKNDKQSEFIHYVMDFSHTNNVHVIPVIHPRKTIGFLRIEDISGTADLTNAVDNVFIVHRVNNDFKRLSAQTFGWKADNEIYEYSNVIEVCKNRDLGVQDLFVGLYYEKESKRFLNNIGEHKTYGWENNAEIDLNEKFVNPFDL